MTLHATLDTLQQAFPGLPTALFGRWEYISVLVLTLPVLYLTRTLVEWRYRRYYFETNLGFRYAKIRFPYLSLLGNLPGFAKNFAQVYDFKNSLRQEIGGERTMVSPLPMWMSHFSVLNTIDPLVVKHILKDDFNSFIKGDGIQKFLKELFGNGIFAIDHGPTAADEGRMWAQQRKTASRIFTRNAFRQHMTQVFTKHATTLAQVVDAYGDAPVEMQALMFKYTLDSIGSIGYGVELHSLTQARGPFEEAFDMAQRLIARRGIRPMWSIPVLGYLLYRDERQLARHIRALDEFSMGIIEKRRREHLEGKLDAHEDILSLFMADDEAKYDDKLLRDVVMSFLVAGRDTTACTLSFALMLLATHTDEQTKLRAEVRSVLGSRVDRFVTLDEVKAMKLLNGVINESLRLYPPVPSDTKVAGRDSVLPDGRVIPKGTRVTYEIYQMGREGSFWPDPLSFVPERWAAANPTPFEFPVFQAGPRVCLGQSMAMFEAGLLLAFLVDRYEMELADKTREITYEPGITLSVKGGLPLRMKQAA